MLDIFYVPNFGRLAKTGVFQQPRLFTTPTIRMMNEHRISLFVLLACCLPLTAIAQQNRHQLSAAEREHVFDGEFKAVLTTDGIPVNIKQAFSEITRQPSFALANPGQKYQVADVIVDRNLPFRRLVFAAVGYDKWIIHYERGGRGHGYYVVVFKVDPHGDEHFVWGGSGADGAKNVEQLRKMVAAGQFSDTGNYYW